MAPAARSSSPSFLLLHRLQATSSSSSADDNDGEESSSSDDNAFYRDLEFAKISKQGASIPPEQARESAKEAESDFLKAMKETRDEFQQAKAELGSEGAVDLFLDRLRDDDEDDEEEEDQQSDEADQSDAFQ